ncbi:ABC transporter permease [Legionella spiritensis]|uniref:ABC transporter permease n=1 Tax=Legionella spiritensis TaxID=452 RepID=A0A0W0ZAI9_LEGSP|nr:FtsX-like permease family protein [Legionella spiritensis]KTD66135.1 ABC transporter permease [Legionella spiritensis]SNV43999.1 ABC transporter permease [Legionella spiritensis]VEG90729.1 ABC transporter permease [Legionella spiritensis]
MKLLLHIALKHLLARKRQSIVSLSGIILGVAFFLTISSTMQGSEKDFIRRLINNLAHISISDEFRNPRRQPILKYYQTGALELRHVQPVTETRGIRGYKKILRYLDSFPDLIAAPVLKGQVLVNFAGKDYGITINGMIPEDISRVTTLADYMKYGSLDGLIADQNGIIIGDELARKLSRTLGDNLTVVATTGQIRVFKIAGIFHTGRSDIDNGQAYAELKRVQALLDRPNRANAIVIKLQDPYQAYPLATRIENQISYKSVSWQEASEDLLNTLMIRNIIMYSVVSAVLIVAAFGIYNVISTVVMEKHRDIAILKSMGFHAADIQRLFIMQGIILGVCGCLLGLPLGCLLMYGMMQFEFKIPGSSEIVHLPLDWGWPQFAVAAAFALLAALIATLLPARKAALVQPVDILRGEV